VVAGAIQTIQRILEEHGQVLEQKGSISTMRLILEKVIRFTLKEQQHANIHNRVVPSPPRPSSSCRPSST
jgi:hypothetical protein